MDKQGSLDFQWKIIIFVNDHFQKLEKGKKVKKRRKTKIKKSSHYLFTKKYFTPSWVIKETNTEIEI